MGNAIMWKKSTVTLVEDFGRQFFVDTTGQQENQNFMKLKLRHGSTTFTVCNTHLKAKPGNEQIRLRQVQQITKALENEEKNVIVCGDFNEIAEMPAIQEMLN